LSKPVSPGRLEALARPGGVAGRAACAAATRPPPRAIPAALPEHARRSQPTRAARSRVTALQQPRWILAVARNTIQRILTLSGRRVPYDRAGLGGAQLMTSAGIRKISDTVWRSRLYKPGMRVPARVYATERLLQGWTRGSSTRSQRRDPAGIVTCAFCMPDGHWGTASRSGASRRWTRAPGSSPRRIGFDINCGMRLLLTNLTEEQSGRGCGSSSTDSSHESRPGSAAGDSSSSPRRSSAASWSEALPGASGRATAGRRLERTEEGGCIAGADASTISERAVARGLEQIGTLAPAHYSRSSRAAGEHRRRRAGRRLRITLPNQSS